MGNRLTIQKIKARCQFWKRLMQASKIDQGKKMKKKSQNINMNETNGYHNTDSKY